MQKRLAMATFQINSDFINEIKDLIAKGDKTRIKSKLKSAHYADLGEIIEAISLEEATYLIKLLGSDKTADALAEVDPDIREGILEQLSAKEIAKEVLELDTDDATDIILELPADRQEKVMSQIEDDEHVSDIRDLLKYDENTAGGLMAKELVKVNEDLSVLKCLNEMRAQAENVTRVHSIYVVDKNNKLKGRLSLKDLITANSRAKVKDIYIPKVDYVTVDQENEEVAKIMSKYDLEAIPVVNDKKELLGRITIDDVVDVIIEDAERDYQLASGISEDVEGKDSVWTLTRARLPWLLIGLGGGIGGAYVIGAFDIENNPEMALFIPLIAAMGGNVGVQSSAIVVQGLASANVNMGNVFGRLVKELGVGLVNGVICSAIIFMSSLLLGFGWMLSSTVSASLLCVIVFAALFGAFVPLMLEKRNIDPALATGPFITTANDIMGLIIYFSIGSLIASIL